MMGGLTSRCSGRRARGLAPDNGRPRSPAAADRGRWTDLKGAGEKPDLDEREAFGWEHPMNGIWPSCALAETMVAVPR